MELGSSIDLVAMLELDSITGGNQSHLKLVAASRYSEEDPGSWPLADSCPRAACCYRSDSSIRPCPASCFAAAYQRVRQDQPRGPLVARRHQGQGGPPPSLVVPWAPRPSMACHPRRRCRRPAASWCQSDRGPGRASVLEQPSLEPPLAGLTGPTAGRTLRTSRHSAFLLDRCLGCLESTKTRQQA